ncbi:MAG: hypothetical protein R3349_11805, partial [Geminicoccaceae bacterium]|nr:hypothetical protein [Geminicoccaceae bacterium]
MKRARPEAVSDLFAEPRVDDGSIKQATADPLPTVPVLVPLPLDEPFDYRIAGEPPAPGSVVEVPFGPRDVIGVVWPSRGGRVVAADRLKPVRRRLEAPPLPGPLLRLIEHVAATALAPLGNALKLALPVPAALEPPPVRLGLRR